MTIKNILQSFLLFLMILPVFGQISTGTAVPLIPGKTIPFEGEKCASSYLDEYLLRTNPTYKLNRDQIELFTQQYANSQSARSGRGVVYTIPIVFHIMHEGENVGDSTNIPDAQVHSCIAALNRDFRRNSMDGGIAQSGPLGTDAEIEFCIARRDPNGNYTNGITRHDMSANQGYLDSGVYHNAATWRSDASVKGAVQWNPAQYLNVWVVNKIKSTTNIYAGGGGGVIGYAQFPGGPASEDGVVIRFSATGNDISGANGFNLWAQTNDNRVLTHELGHYFNLLHTFQSTTTCSPGTPCATSGDNCCDTPPTTVGTGNACVTLACPLDNKENYMQYQNGACASDFTPNQVTRMRAVLAPGGSRNSLTTTQNCTSPFQYNVSISNIIYPKDTVCTNIIPAYVLICNGGWDTLRSFNVIYNIDIGGVLTYYWTGKISPGDCDTINLPSIITTSGAHTYNVAVDTNLINGFNKDGSVADNFMSSAFYSKDGYGVVVDITTDCNAQELSWSIKDITGSVKLSGSGYVQLVQNIFETACLDSGCYTFTIYDSGGNGLQKSGLCPTSGKFSVVDISTGQTIAKSINPNFGDSAIYSFCLPYNASLTPGFTGCDTVYPGYPVYFMDTSISFPAAYRWKWDFGDGTSSILSNPVKRYPVVGTYNVELLVENASLIDSITTAGCVVVIPTPPGFCDTLDNYTNADTMIFYNLLGTWGYYPGHNGANLSGYAEPFNLITASNTIQRVILPVVRAHSGTPSSTFIVNVYADNAGSPGAVLASDTILISSLVEGVSNEVYLTTPPFVTGNFWAGIELNYGVGDTLVLTAALHRIGGVNTTYVKTAGVWQSSTTVAAINSSTGLRVIYTDLPATGTMNVSRSRICQGQSTNFSATSLSNYDSLKWFFPGGTPSYSTSTSQSVTYTSAGRYKAILYLEGICSNDSIIKYIIVDTAGSSASFTETTLSVCEQDSIYFNGSVTGAGTISWTFPGGVPSVSSQEDDTVFFTVPGVFNVKMKVVNGCGSDSVSKVLTVRSYPTTTILPGDTTICDGSSVTFTSAGGTSFNWSNGPTTARNTISPLATTQYWAVASNGTCKGDTAYVKVTNNPIPVVVANATPDTICLGSDIYFSMTGSNAISYDWDFNDLNTSVIPNVMHTYSTAGTYTVTLNGVYGVCESTDVIKVKVVNCTGIDDKNIAESIVVYPNPANNYLSISFVNNEMKEVSVDMISSSGKIVFFTKMENKGEVTSIDLSDISEGIYLLRFNTEHKVFTKKVMVVK